MNPKLLEVKDLRVDFTTDEGTITAVNRVCFHMEEGETLGLVGESGSGKSVTALSILRLISQPPGKISEGKILFQGENLLRKTEKEMLSFRGREAAMIFQEPMTSLNPVFTCGDQIVEAIRRHQKVGRKEAWERGITMLDMVGIPSPKERMNTYPHQLSGGMRQRVMIAIALSCTPKLLIADEPTTALDVTTQAQILDLMMRLQKNLGMGIMLITHDLGVVAETVKRVIVMYAGRIMEEAPVESLFASPGHPYTEGLLRSIPRLGEKSRRLNVIEGSVPNPLEMPRGCPFYPRCPFSEKRCEEEAPGLFEIAPGHSSACWKHKEVFQ